MVEKEVVIGTIKKMYDSGIDDETVRSTLRDIGLSKAEITAMVNEVKGTGKGEQPRGWEFPPEKPAAGKPSAEIHEEIAAKTAEKIKAHLEAEKAERALGETTTKIETAEQGEKLGEIHDSIGKLHEKVASVSSMPSAVAERINSIDKRITSLEKDIGEIKAGTNALQSLLKKILSTDREVLVNLSRKK